MLYLTGNKEMLNGVLMSHMGVNTKQKHFLLSLKCKSRQQSRLKDTEETSEV